MTDQPKGWHVVVNGPSKRGKYRPEIMQGDVIRAVSPVRRAFATAKEAEKDGKELLDIGVMEAYERGRKDGENSGYEAGKVDGKAAGQAAGEEIGYAKGKAAGEAASADARDTARAAGRREGIDEGTTSGFIKGSLSIAIVLVAVYGLLNHLAVL